MTVSLLDANVLIALMVEDHEHHDRVGAWFAGGVAFATCPIVEGALVRFVVRLGEPAVTAQELLRAVHAHADCRRWSDDVSYSEIDLADVRGHQQVTDSYLVGLAEAHGGVLVTLDAALAERRPSRVSLVPELRDLT